MTEKQADDYYAAWSAGYDAGWQDGAEYIKTFMENDLKRSLGFPTSTAPHKPQESVKSSPPEKPAPKDQP